MKDVLLSPISLKDFEILIRDCVKSELQNHKSEPAPETDFITRKEAAKILGISLPTLSDWSKRNIIPFYRIGTRVRYKKAEVENSVSQVRNIKFKKA